MTGWRWLGRDEGPLLMEVARKLSRQLGLVFPGGDNAWLEDDGATRWFHALLCCEGRAVGYAGLKSSRSRLRAGTATLLGPMLVEASARDFLLSHLPAFYHHTAMLGIRRLWKPVGAAAPAGSEWHPALEVQPEVFQSLRDEGWTWHARVHQLVHHKLPADGPSLPEPLRLEAGGDQREVIAALYNQCFGHCDHRIPVDAGEFSHLAPADALILYYREDPAGFCTLHRESGWIQDMGVVPGLQGRGYGRLLLAATLAHLSSSGARSACLSVMDANQRAQHLYRTAGFSDVAGWDLYRRALESWCACHSSKSCRG